MSNTSLLTYFGHHKCATTWIGDILSQVCKIIGLEFVNVNNPSMFDHDLYSFVLKNNIDFLAYINADLKHVKELDNIKGFHVIRDPRDIIISAYFSHLNSHSTVGWPALLAHRERLINTSKDQGIFLEMEFNRNVFENLYDWNYSQPNVLEIKMEDLIQETSNSFVKVFEFLELMEESTQKNRKKIPVRELQAVIFNNRFSIKANGRNTGSEDVKSHYRIGIAGDWINHFNSEHKEYFKKNYHYLLLKLKYEENVDW